jgi:hypothetical protein
MTSAHHITAYPALLRKRLKPLSTPTPISFVPTSIPEPSNWALMAVGFAGLGFAGYGTARKVVSIAA